MLKYSSFDPLACKKFTLRLVGNMFRDGINYIKVRFKNVKIPVLMLGGKLDPLVNAGKFSQVLEKFGSENKTLKIYENVKHRIVQNEYKDEAIADIIEWINKNI